MAEEAGGGALREILAFFDIQVGQEQLEKATTAIDQMKKRFKEVGEVALAGFAVEKLKEFVKETVEMGEKIGDMSKRLGVSTDQLQLFQGMLDLSGASADDAALMFRFFNKAVLGASTGNAGAAEAFNKLGIKTVDNNGKMITLTGSLEDVAAGLEKIEDPVEKAKVKMEVFGKMGGRLNEMFEKGADGIKELKKEVLEAGGVLDADFIRKAKEAGDEMKKVEMATKSLKATFIVEFMPSIRNLVVHIRQGIMWFKDLAAHTYIVKEAITALATVGLVKLLKALMELKSFFGVKKAEGLIANLFGMGEMGLIIMAVVALYLIFDDLFNLFAGNESLIGDTLFTMLGFDRASVIVTNLREAWDNLTDSISGLGASLPSMLSVLEAIVLAIVVIVEWWVILEQIVAAVFNTIYAIYAMIKAIAKGEGMKGISDALDVWDKDTDKNGSRISKAFSGALASADAIVPALATGNDRVIATNPAYNFHGGINVNIRGEQIADPSKMSEAQLDAYNKAIMAGVQQGLSSDQQIQAAYAAATSRGYNPKAVDSGANK